MVICVVDVFVLSCVKRGLAEGRSSFEGVLTRVQKITVSRN